MQNHFHSTWMVNSSPGVAITVGVRANTEVGTQQINTDSKGGGDSQNIQPSQIAQLMIKT